MQHRGRCPVWRKETLGLARRFLTNLAPGNRELNDILVRRGVPPSMQTVDEIESIVAQATTSGGRPAWAADDWCSPELAGPAVRAALFYRVAAWLARRVCRAGKPCRGRLCSHSRRTRSVTSVE